TRLVLFLARHERMAELLPAALHGQVAAVMFNLGYLPGEDGDKGIVTKPGTTVAALDAALGLLRPGGVITVAVYPGHDGGREEADAVDAWFRQLPPSEGQAVVYRMPQKPHAPYLLAAERRSKE